MGNFKLILPLQKNGYRFSHSKFYMFDQNKIIITSANFSKQGICDSGQFETGVLIKLNQTEEFIDTINDCVVIEDPNILAEKVIGKRNEIKQKSEYFSKFTNEDKKNIKNIIYSDLINNQNE
jgi:phosphatidylserine/phosphatidylglycerophosphate/cardiolipin synthase-like enzyme